MLLRSRMFAEWSRNDHRTAANEMPTGLFRPSNAMALPVKPSPVWKVIDEYECDSPSRAGRPTSPAVAPDMIRATAVIFLTLTPLAWAAVDDRPVARRS